MVVVERAVTCSGGVEGVVDDVQAKVPPSHFAKNGAVYPVVCGGESVPVGYIEGGVAYRHIIGGPDVPMDIFKFG